MLERVWLDGALLPRDEARIPVDDRGFLYGAACFETMRTIGGVVFRLDRHFDRLERGLRGLGVEPPARALLRTAIAATLEANALSDARIRLTVSAGNSGGRAGLRPAAAPAVLVAAEPPPPDPGPARALVAREVRVDASRPLPFAKTANYLPSLLALEEARRAGFEQALLLDAADEVVEAATANLFAVADGVLLTPPLAAGPLPGITREAVLECARDLGLPAEERRLPLALLEGASELLLTSSVIGVQPLAELRIDARTWCPSEPRRIADVLASAYEQLLLRERDRARNEGSRTKP